jgi:hypothetical protein
MNAEQLIVTRYKNANFFQSFSVVKLKGMSVGPATNKALVNLTWPSWCMVRIQLPASVALCGLAYV